MSSYSKIEWTDATWNPVRGCTKISPGCKHCYAETFAERFRGVKGHPYEQGFDLKLVPHKLTEPFTWRSPKLVFVNSMSDLFQPGVPDSYIEAVCQVMVKAKWHTFQVLTKRSERLQELLSGPLRFAAEQDHIWWGVSVEDRQYGLPRIADLQRTPARVRFLSIEPLLEDLGPFDLSKISWAIVGGESGPGARLMQKDWVLSIRDQCREANVPFFFKQWGGVRKKRNGRLLDGRTYDEYPQRVISAIPERENLLAFARDVTESFLRNAAGPSLVPISAQNLPSPKSGSASMKCFRLFLVFCSLTLLSSAQDPSAWLSDLPQPKDYVQHRSSSYDRSGGNADARPIPPGETLTLLDESGPGLITHFWATIASDDPNHLKALVLRMYWDGETSPSVEAPIGDFFGLGLGTYFLYQSTPLSVGSDKALNCFFPMPFQKHARITVTNEVRKEPTAFTSTSTTARIAGLCRPIRFTFTHNTAKPRPPKAGPTSGSRTAIRWSIKRKI